MFCLVYSVKTTAPGGNETCITTPPAGTCMREPWGPSLYTEHAIRPWRAREISWASTFAMLVQPISHSSTHIRKSSTAAPNTPPPGNRQGVLHSGASPTHKSSMQRPAITRAVLAFCAPPSFAPQPPARTAAAAACHGDLSFSHLVVRRNRHSTTLGASRAGRKVNGSGRGAQS